MIPLDVWAEKIRKLRDQVDPLVMAHCFFFRDPPRPIWIDPEVMYCPADGIVLYAREVDSDGRIEVKGEEYSLSDLMGMEWKWRALVVGIFMTQWDVHVNRVPISSVWVESRQLEPLRTRNLPMLWVEKGLVDLARVDLKGKIGYLTENSRVRNRFWSEQWGLPYWVIQIADVDVDVISPFEKPPVWVFQNKRFSMVRWGSQVDVVVPIVRHLRYRVLVKEAHHVKAGLDRMLAIESN